MLFVYAGILGAVLGSFLNALSFRIDTGQSIMLGRSRCMHCRHPLSSIDLVPVFSYVLLRGRCRYCKGAISPQYPLVELTAACITMALIYTTHDLSTFAYWCAVWLLLLFIVIYDLRHTIIPWPSLVLIGILSLARSVLAPSAFYDVLAGPLLAAPLLLLSFVSRGRWMGWGDGWLELSLGWLLGLWLGISALLLSFWVGAAIGIVLLFASRRWNKRSSRFTMKSEIPFAPFLVLGAAIAYFFHVDIFASLTSASW